ncbi:N-acetyltransferase [Sulfitobacter sp. CW3]|uniref:GNAT family N-acetyltransferase n=1 Tax=Sulfitobacter sp. CW3 TaxID=2861965 RepID=UPI0027E4139C|nr:N-acetyltransferase [Sulfitobacter sp. CW3]
MTPDQMAEIHAAAFLCDRNWNAAEITDLLTSPFVTALHEAGGFALTRLVAGETELLTIAVDPAHQNQGIGRRLMHKWLTCGADTAFLEVAADNTPAIALYESLGFHQTSRRPRYYARKDGAFIDALILSKDLTHGKSVDSGP